MCGIIAVKRFDGAPARRMAIKRYLFQKERGEEGFGFLAISNGEIKDYWRCETEELMMNELQKQTAHEIILHHRKPTSTPNFWETAHPIFVSHPSLKHDYYVVHNGVIRNAEDLKKAHDQQGFEYRTLITQVWTTRSSEVRTADTKFNDSEAFAIELAQDLDKEGTGADACEGTIAFVAIQVTKNEPFQVRKMFWGRNFGNPLLFMKNSQYMTITSEGEGEEVEAHTLFSYDYATGDIQKKKYQVGLTTYASNYHYNKPYTAYPLGYQRSIEPPKDVTKKPVDKAEKHICDRDPKEGLPDIRHDMSQEALFDEYLSLSEELDTIELIIQRHESADMTLYYIERRQHIKDLIDDINMIFQNRSIEDSINQRFPE